MKRLLRSVIAFDEGISQEALNSNWLKLKASSARSMANARQRPTPMATARPPLPP